MGVDKNRSEQGEEERGKGVEMVEKTRMEKNGAKKRGWPVEEKRIEEKVLGVKGVEEKGWRSGGEGV